MIQISSLKKHLVFIEKKNAELSLSVREVNSCREKTDTLNVNFVATVSSGHLSSF